MNFEKGEEVKLVSAAESVVGANNDQYSKDDDCKWPNIFYRKVWHYLLQEQYESGK